jgi:hypothetical protein
MLMKLRQVLALAGGLTAVALMTPATASADGANAADVARWKAAWNSHNIDQVVALFSRHWRGPYTNPATGQTAQPNGRGFDHPGAMYIVYGPNHLIKRLRIFWDTLTVDRQLGVKP